MRFFRNRKGFLCAAVLLGCIGCSSGCTRRKGTGDLARTEFMMGTYVNARLVDPEKCDRELEHVMDEAFRIARELEARFSVFLPESELNRLNREKRMRLSRELFDLLRMAEEMRYITRGGFDVSVAPLLRESGFYHEMPPELKAMMNGAAFPGTGMVFEEDTLTVEIPGGSWLDLSGIAKGFIVDRMGELIEESGVDSFMIDAGGDILCRTGEHKSGWRVGLRSPGEEEVFTVFVLESRAVATSGDYENFIPGSEGARPLSHIVDPLSGRMLTKGPSSVTVITGELARADAFATGFMAVGAEAAVELAEGLDDVEVMCLRHSPEGLSVLSTESVGRYVFDGRP